MRRLESAWSRAMYRIAHGLVASLVRQHIGDDRLGVLQVDSRRCCAARKIWVGVAVGSKFPGRWEPRRCWRFFPGRREVPHAEGFQGQQDVRAMLMHRIAAMTNGEGATSHRRCLQVKRAEIYPPRDYRSSPACLHACPGSCRVKAQALCRRRRNSAPNPRADNISKAAPGNGTDDTVIRFWLEFLSCRMPS